MNHRKDGQGGERAAMLFFGVAAAAYLLTIPVKPYPLSFLVKAFPVLFLAVRVWRGSTALPERLVAVGLFFSALGDVLLDLDDRLFFAGLGAFLVGHLFYCAGFLPRIEVTARKLWFAAGLLVYGVILNAVLASKVGIQLPLVVYGTVLTAMGIAAGFRRDSPGWVWTGALWFVLSDSMIAVNRFVEPFGASRWAVMVTYYLGQFFIAEGVLRERRGR